MDDGLPPELFKTGGVHLQEKLLTIFKDIWHQHAVLQDFKNALTVHVFKKKGDRSVCDDYRGISLLSIPGKILGRIILNRLMRYVLAFCQKASAGSSQAVVLLT